MKNDPKVLAAFRAMSMEQKFEAFARAQSDPICRILNEIEVTDTQQEAAKALAECRDLLQMLSSEDRKRIMLEVDKMIDEKPVV